jgi:hypothetical protein
MLLGLSHEFLLAVVLGAQGLEVGGACGRQSAQGGDEGTGHGCDLGDLAPWHLHNLIHVWQRRHQVSKVGTGHWLGRDAVVFQELAQDVQLCGADGAIVQLGLQMPSQVGVEVRQDLGGFGALRTTHGDTGVSGPMVATNPQ